MKHTVTATSVVEAMLQDDGFRPSNTPEAPRVPRPPSPKETEPKLPPRRFVDPFC